MKTGSYREDLAGRTTKTIKNLVCLQFVLPLIFKRDSLTYDICESGSGGILNVAIHYIDG